jgi:hypothetical protein
LVLKAAGCENVVYATRRGEESTFAQGVARRLFGPAYEQEHLGKKLFDLDSATSSFQHSLSAADAVLCTDWNRFALKDGVHPMVAEAYSAPYYLSSRSGLRDQNLVPLLDPSERTPEGTPKFLGCYGAL